MRAPITLADKPPIPDNVATADRINQRFASLMVQNQSIVHDTFIPRAPDHENDQDHLIHTLLPTHPDFGGSFQE